ncbi:hypothetical protein L5515_019027 [Caenorhabditis briggsae]|uniref:Uncharacterized protein n=1 Tax=Caenorhabditis briggsae TaxID=6238 RepID=A0AAE9JSL8_CAEBR|nr:hypothetical protein L5515_019027 [Caenorhabditis briggsae]
MNGNGNGNGGIPVVNAPPPPAPAPDPRQAAQLDRSDKEAARQEYLSATNAHEKTLENVRRLRQKKEEYNANIRNLTDSMDGESCPEKKEGLAGLYQKAKKDPHELSQEGEGGAEGGGKSENGDGRR